MDNSRDRAPGGPPEDPPDDPTDDPPGEPSPAERAPVLSFSPNPLVAGTLIVALLVFGGLLVTTSDRQGRILYVLVCLVLAAVCATDLVWRPRLRLSRNGLSVRSPSATVTLAWADVERFAVDERPRFGVAVRTLEIDAGEKLIVLSQRALGADPREIVRLADALRPAR